MIVPGALVPLYLHLARANRPYRNADAARRRVRARVRHPASHEPPRLLRPRVQIEVARRHGWPVYRITPRDRRTTGSVIYLHGGGWVEQIALQHWQLAAHVAVECGTTVDVPIYPLVPVGLASDVVTIVARMVRENLDALGPTCVAGDSAGGQIALSAALVLRDHGIALPSTVLISPALDLGFSNPSIPVVQPSDPWLGVPGGRVFTDLWRGTLDVSDPTVSPLFGSFVGLGPLTVLTGTRDILNPDAHLLAERATDAGATVELIERPGGLHVFPLLPTRAGRAARARIVDILRGAVRGGGSAPA